MVRVAADLGLSDKEIVEFQSLLENPEALLGIKTQVRAIENKNDQEMRHWYNYLENKERLLNIPKKAFSTNINSMHYQLLYDQYYNELLNIYEGTVYKNIDFENYIIESYLRRRNK